MLQQKCCIKKGCRLGFTQVRQLSELGSSGQKKSSTRSASPKDTSPLTASEVSFPKGTPFVVRILRIASKSKRFPSLYYLSEILVRINVKGKKFWLHCASNNLWTHFSPHQKRGCDAMNEIGILPTFKGALCHDHWKPYYKYDCTYALCNAHHLRDLTRAWEQDNQSWAEKLIGLLEEINRAVNGAGGKLAISESKKYRQRYREFLKEGEKESPPPDEATRKGKRGRLKRTKSR